MSDTEVKRGRPASGDAQSGASRQAAYRARKKAEGKEQLTVMLDADLAVALRAYVDRINQDSARDQVTLGDAAGRILRDRLLRKR